MQASGFQIIQALRPMDLIDRLRNFQFDEDKSFDQQVSRIIPNHDTIISNSHTMLLRHKQPSLPKLMHQGVLIDFLKKAGPNP
jgi:hypothetical protein